MNPQYFTCGLSHSSILDSTLDRDTTVCFLLLQDTKFPPTKMQQPVVDLLSILDPAQSTTAKHSIRVCPWSLYKMPRLGAPFKQHKICSKAAQFLIVGAHITILTEYATSGRVTVMQFNFPTNFLYLSGSSTGSPSSLVK